MDDARRFELEPRDPYSLAASMRFLEGFAPAAHEGAGDHLHLAFPDAEGEPAGVCVRADGEAIAGEVFGGADVGWARAEIERILSLDADGRSLPRSASATRWSAASSSGCRDCGRCCSTRPTRPALGR